VARQAYQTVDLLGIGIPVTGETGLLGPFGSMDARLLFSQDLINVADMRAWRASRTQRDSSRLLVDNARELVALNVVAVFLDALRAKATRDTLSAQTKLADELYRFTRDRVTQGVSAELDANRAMQEVNSLEQQRLEAEQNYVAAKLKLANIMQANVTPNFEVVGDAAYGTGTAPDRNASLQAAFATRSDYRSAIDNVRAAEQQVRAIRAERIPTLRMTFGDGQSGSTPVHNVNTYKLQGAIEVPILTGGRVHGEIEEAEGVLREAGALLDQTRSQIETDVLTAISGVEWALKQLETSAGNLRLSRQEVEFARSRFGQGIADNTEVVNAQDRLTRADDAHIRAEYALGLARANLARAIGVAEKTYRR
jgi:outer membrane protein TolC